METGPVADVPTQVTAAATALGTMRGMGGKRRTARAASTPAPLSSPKTRVVSDYFLDWQNPNTRFCGLSIPDCPGEAGCRHRDLLALATAPGTSDDILAAIAQARLPGPEYRAALCALLQRDALSTRARRAAACTAAALIPDQWYRRPGGTDSGAVWQALLTRTDLTQQDLLAALDGIPPNADIVIEVLRSAALSPLAEAALAYQIRQYCRVTTGYHADAALPLEDALRTATENGTHPIAAIAYALSALPHNPAWTPKLLLRRARALLNSANVSAEAFTATVTALAPTWTASASDLLAVTTRIVT